MIRRIRGLRGTRALLLAASAAMAFVTGCASPTGPNPAVCAAVGTLLGGGAGLAVADRNSDESDRDEIVGGAVGGVVLGTAAYFLCKAMAKEEPAPEAAPRAVPEAPAPEPAPPQEDRIVLRGVNFDFDKSDIRPDAAVILDEAASVLAGRSSSVTVVGHTDATGPDAYNQTLSESRAASVQAYLASKGIDSSRLSTSGAGESQPIADNGTSDGRALNRRVELNLSE